MRVTKDELVNRWLEQFCGKHTNLILEDETENNEFWFYDQRSQTNLIVRLTIVNGKVKVFSKKRIKE